MAALEWGISAAFISTLVALSILQAGALLGMGLKGISVLFNWLPAFSTGSNLSAAAGAATVWFMTGYRYLPSTKIGVTNPVPSRLARIIPARHLKSPRIGAPGADDVFVTAADDILGYSNSNALAKRLTLVDDSGALLKGPLAVIEFDTPAIGIASPVFRNFPGFVGRGQTLGGAREFVIPNLSVESLVNVIVRIVQ